MLRNIYLILQSVTQNNFCIFAGPCANDGQCLGNGGADVCVKADPADANGQCGM